MNDEQFAEGGGRRGSQLPPPAWWPQDSTPRPGGSERPGTGAATVAGADPVAPADHPAGARRAGDGRSSRAGVGRWIVAAVAGVTVAALAVLGIDAVASAATSSASRAPVFGPFGNTPSRQPPFLAGRQPLGGTGAGQPQRRPATTTPAATVEGTITSIDGDRLDVAAGIAGTTGTVVQLTGTTAIRDGTSVLHAEQLRRSEHVRIAGTRTNGVLHADTVEVIH